MLTIAAIASGTKSICELFTACKENNSYAVFNNNLGIRTSGQKLHSQIHVPNNPDYFYL